MAGLHFWHTVNGATWNGKDMLSQTRQGIKKLVPISSKRAKRPPVTIEHLYALRKGLDLTNAFDAAVWAVACVAFWSCCRLGELVVPSTNLFNSAKHVGRSASPSFSSLGNGVDFATFHIPWTKTTFSDGANISVTARPNDPSCPISALRSKRLISYDDRLSLPYVEALCREVARWRPVFPLSLFHACSSDDVYKGFYIPKGQQIITNWAVCVHNIIYRSNSSEQHLVSLYLHSKARHVVLTVERSLTGQLLMIQRDILTRMRSTPTVSSMKMEI